MNRTIKKGEADQKAIRGIAFPLNVKRYPCEERAQPRIARVDFLTARNFARRLKTLSRPMSTSEKSERRNLIKTFSIQSIRCRD